MNFKFLLLPMRSLSTLIAILGFQQMLFGHHAEVMKGNTFLQKEQSGYTPFIKMHWKNISRTKTMSN